MIEPTLKTEWPKPMGRRDRLGIRWHFFKYDVREWWNYYLWAAVARRLPRRLMYAAVIQATAVDTAARNVGPDEITFESLANTFAPKSCR